MASISVPCPKTTLICRSASTPQFPNHQSKISFPHGSNSRAMLKSGSSFDDFAAFGIKCPMRKQNAVWKVFSKQTSNSAPVVETKLVKDESAEKLSVPSTITDESSISAFMSQVTDLVKLVDSRDIMELQLKQLDCELLIRKKEAMQPPQQAAPMYTMQPPMPQSMYQSQPPPAPTAAPNPAPSAVPPALPAPAKTSKSSHPPFKCPMAGTFYRCPAPGEPPFVKVGDKVQKGQVICIIEAMKLMNEIEADQTGTITEILAEDGKPVSVDTPLLVIAP